MSNEDQTIAVSQLRAALKALGLDPHTVIGLKIKPGRAEVKEIERHADGSSVKNSNHNIVFSRRTIRFVADELCVPGSVDGSDLAENE